MGAVMCLSLYRRESVGISLRGRIDGGIVVAMGVKGTVR